MAEPTRTCIGCRTRAPAGTLARLARRGDGSLVVDREAPGRGAWLCREPTTGGVSVQCLIVAAHRDAFRKAFRTAVTPESWKTLREHTAERANMVTGSTTREGRHEKGTTQQLAE